VTLPRNNQANLQDLAYREKATKLAKELHERALKGESMDKLQSEACAALAFKDRQGTLMLPLRRGALEAKTEQELFALNPEGVSTISENPSVYVFYKLESRKTLTLDDVKPEISQRLYREKLDKLTKAVTESLHINYNNDYFRSTSPVNWVPSGASEKSSFQKSSAATQPASAASPR